MPALMYTKFLMLKRNAYRIFFFLEETARHGWEGEKAEAHTITCHEDTEGRG